MDKIEKATIRQIYDFLMCIFKQKNFCRSAFWVAIFEKVFALPILRKNLRVVRFLIDSFLVNGRVNHLCDSRGGRRIGNHALCDSDSMSHSRHKKTPSDKDGVFYKEDRIDRRRYYFASALICLDRRDTLREAVFSCIRPLFAPRIIFG